MTRTSKLTFLCAVLLLAPLALHGQDGCVDSPENPTVVLAVIGSAGALFTTLRTRIKSRRDSSR